MEGYNHVHDEIHDNVRGRRSGSAGDAGRSFVSVTLVVSTDARIGSGERR